MFQGDAADDSARITLAGIMIPREISRS